MQLSIVYGRPTIQGELDLAVLPELEHWLASLHGHHEIDLSGVTFFDSSALRAFLNARHQKRDLRMVQPSEAVRKVLEITGTIDYFVDRRDIT